MKRIVIWALATSVGFSSGAARACEQWDLSGPVTIVQANGITVLADFRQSGGSLTGTAWYIAKRLRGADQDVEVKGTLEQGLVADDRVRFRVRWIGLWSGTTNLAWQGTGVYEGTVHEGGFVEGINFDMQDSQNKVAWSLRDPARCAISSSAEPSAPKKVTGLGKKPASAAPGVGDVTREPGDIAGIRPRCKQGFVWREARANDYICVTPESRTLVAQENAVAASRRDPGGAYGPDTCISGFVWREAFDGDTVCVTPERRTSVGEENRSGPSRTE